MVIQWYTVILIYVYKHTCITYYNVYISTAYCIRLSCSGTNVDVSIARCCRCSAEVFSRIWVMAEIAKAQLGSGFFPPLLSSNCFVCSSFPSKDRYIDR